MQVGYQGISFIQFDNVNNTFLALEVYHFAKQLHSNSIAEQINEILAAENLLQQHFKKIFVTWCFDESIVVPHEYFNPANAKEMITLVYGDVEQSAVQNEIVLSQNLHTVYRVPAAVKNAITHWFPFCIQNHQNSLLINFGKANSNLMYCHFYPNSFTVLLRKNAQLQVIQNFDFNTPEDALYHLLNVCRSFGINAEQTTLTVSGMIDTDSNLYNELYKYFLQIDLAGLPDYYNYAEEIKNHPAHYFSHLFTTALCVL